MKRSSTDRLIAKAQDAINSGRVEEARVLLEAAARQESDDPRVWFMLAGISRSARERRALLAQAERVKPASTVPAAGAATAFFPATSPDRLNSNWTRFAVRGGIVLLLVSVLTLSALFVQRGPAGNALVPDAVERFNDRAAEEAFDQLVLPGQDNGLQVGESGMQEARPSPTIAAPAEEVPAIGVPPETAGDVPVDGQPRPPAKQVDASSGPLPTWTPTLLPTPTLAPTATPTVTPEPTATLEPPPPGSPRPQGVGPAERWIDVNLANQTLTAYEGDAAVFSTLVSSGTWQHPTVTGQFRTWIKYESQTMNGYLLGYDYYLEDVPYVMYFFNDYAIHGAYWHNNFGVPMSHGCVNVSPADAGWLFNWAPIGTLVNVY